MLEADPAELVGQGEQELIFVEMDGAEQSHLLLGEPAVDGDLLGRRGEVAGLVGEDVEVDIVGRAARAAQ